VGLQLDLRSPSEKSLDDEITLWIFIGNRIVSSIIVRIRQLWIREESNLWQGRKLLECLLISDRKEAGIL